MTHHNEEQRLITGKKALVSGRYRFHGYLDGTSYPPPHPNEMEVSVSKDTVFPPIRSTGKACFWLVVK
jgi:hypothetical protein